VSNPKAQVPTEEITRAILVLRGHRVLLDSELASLYGATTKRFNEQVRRNRKRFPADFMFQLTAEESSSLRSQFATLKTGRGQHRKYLPYVFTEHGAIMAATILDSPRAVEINVTTAKMWRLRRPRRNVPCRPAAAPHNSWSEASQKIHDTRR